MTAQIPYDPTAAGYAAEDGDQPVSSKLDGPVGFYRPGVPNSSSHITASWKLDGTAYAAWQSFYGTNLVNGALSFFVNLVLRSAAPDRYRAWFIPGSVKLGGLDGNTFTIQAELEVVPAPISPAYPASLAELPGPTAVIS